MSQVLKDTNTWLQAGTTVAMATVVLGGEGAQLKAGKQIALADDGKGSGSLGHDLLDEIVSEQSRQTLNDGEPRVLTFPAAGDAQVFVERVDDRAEIPRLVRALEGGRACAWVTDLGTGLASVVSKDGYAQGSLGLDDCALSTIGALIEEGASACLETGFESLLFVRTYQP
ncbi:MAG: XdhC family protein [Magnetovibrionaceae bacterium]